MIRRKHLGGVLATSVVALRIPQDLAGRYDRLEYEYGLTQKVEEWRAGRLETASLDELEAALAEVRD
ncbi:Uncharacterised protein [Chlamydia trachomatis]|nr:Uncharacterised protein [Chlamydia trachomatis]CRH88168.1 Uncharacterised protein [Chlamydia trachomatis]